MYILLVLIRYFSRLAGQAAVNLHLSYIVPHKSQGDRESALLSRLNGFLLTKSTAPFEVEAVLLPNGNALDC